MYDKCSKRWINKLPKWCEVVVHNVHTIVVPTVTPPATAAASLKTERRGIGVTNIVGGWLGERAMLRLYPLLRNKRNPFGYIPLYVVFMS